MQLFLVADGDDRISAHFFLLDQAAATKCYVFLVSFVNDERTVLTRCCHAGIEAILRELRQATASIGDDSACKSATVSLLW